MERHEPETMEHQDVESMEYQDVGVTEQPEEVIINPSDVCAVCNIKFAEDEKIAVVKSGIVTFISASKQRGDGKHLRWVAMSSLNVHDKCRKKYIDKKSIEAVRKRKLTTDSVEESNTFDFSRHCFLCGELCDPSVEIKQKIKKRRTITFIQPQSVTEEKIRQSIIENNDTWAQIVHDRIRNTPSLLEVDARYYWDCRQRFVRRSCIAQQEKNSTIDSKFQRLIEYLENCEECQWTMNDFTTYMNNEISEYMLKKLLVKQYGEQIIFTDNHPHSSEIVTFKHTTHQLLKKKFYESFHKNLLQKRCKIIELAANIINEDIREMAFNDSTYPSASGLLNDIKNMIPESLQLLLEQIILKRKRNPACSFTKITSIAHTIIVATRPRSFLSPLCLALSTYVHRKFESKLLVNILSKLGFGESYYETLLYEASATMHGHGNLQPTQDIFLQYAFDNADYNVHTIDGKNTFHNTGGIECITPISSVPADEPIPRLKKLPTEDELAAKGNISIQRFETHNMNGLANITISDLDELHPCEPHSVQLLASEILWVAGKWLQIKNFPEWNGFMELHTSSNEYQQSRVKFLPFINLKSTDDDALFTALTFAISEAKKIHQGTTFVTFNQPLYIKARNIIATITDNNKNTDSLNNDSILNSKNVVVKLGGFHLLMSFLGSIGYIMQGSGLKEAWSSTEVYAKQSIDQMMSGKHYSRSLRAHMLTQSALLQMLLDKSSITRTEQEDIMCLRKDSTKPKKDGSTYMQFIQAVQSDESNRPTLSSLSTSPVCIELENNLKLCIGKIEENNGPTAKLWIQYINLVSLVTTFIMAERTGDWELHLSCVQQMLPYFHSTAHNLYAKSAHLYLQDMLHLNDFMDPREFDQYTKRGYFTIRRTNKFWSGIWSDMTIEQTLMRAMHSQGGITRGRGITESVVSNWINAMPTSLDVCDALESFTEVHDESSEQHKDFRDSSISSNEKDRKKILEWFEERSPFAINDKIMSLSTGICGDATINCWHARKVGVELLNSTKGQNFADVSYKRSKKILPISAVQSSIRVANTRVVVNPTFIFQRIFRLRPSDEDLKGYFYYELSPFLPALFDEAAMRKNTSSPVDIFKSCERPVHTNIFCIIDGEWLISYMTWQLRVTYATVYNSFVQYIKQLYGEKVLVVFHIDRNYAVRFPKFAEQKRMNTKYNSQTTIFNERTLVTVHGNKLLANQENKNLFINQLCNVLNNSGIDCILLGVGESTSSQLIDIDGDAYIINKAIISANENTPTCIVTSNADFLYTLTSMAPINNEIYIMKVQKKEIIWFSVNDQRTEYPHLYPYFAVLHALNGCSTTSALFKIGKKSIFSLFKTLISTTNVSEILNVFIDESSTIDKIKIAGEQLMLLIYKAPTGIKTLNELRCTAFHQLVNKSKKEVSLNYLPPTSEAAFQHCYRTHHQIQVWRGIQKPAESWGWYLNNDTLSPVQTTSKIIPDEIYNMISCRCTTECRSNHCNCKKNNLKCTYACKNCAGSGCENSECFIIDEDNSEKSPTEEFCEYPSSLAVLAEVQIAEDDDASNQAGCSWH